MVQAKPYPPSIPENSQKASLSESQQIIQYNHPEKYRTSEWYSGQGEIATSGDGRSFSISATYTLKVESHRQLCSDFPDSGKGQEVYLKDLGLE